MLTSSINTLAIAATVFVILAIGLVFCVTSLIRGNREDVIASVPVASEQRVRVPTPGPVVVMIETPRTASDFRGFQLQVVDTQTGQTFPMAYSMMTGQEAVYGVTTMQVPFGRFQANASDYIVRVAGLAGDKDYSRCRLIFSRPYLGRMAIQIIGIVLCGVGMLLSVIWLGWMQGWIKPQP